MTAVATDISPLIDRRVVTVISLPTARGSAVPLSMAAPFVIKALARALLIQDITAGSVRLAAL
jgi:hypothetical protein